MQPRETRIANVIAIAETLDTDTRRVTDIMYGRFTSDFMSLIMQYDCTWTEEQRAIIMRLFYWLTNILSRPDDLNSATHRAGHGPAQHIAEVIQCLVALMRTSGNVTFSDDEVKSAKTLAERLYGTAKQSEPSEQ